jgi:hypothetical protein
VHAYGTKRRDVRAVAEPCGTSASRKPEKRQEPIRPNPFNSIWRVTVSEPGQIRGLEPPICPDVSFPTSMTHF